MVLIILVVPFYGFFAYTLPMMDHETEYFVADFHNHVMGTKISYQQ